MAQTNSKYQRGAWTSQAGFMLAALGSAIGLGNIWRFPGVAYENGGGAFLVPYLVALLTAGIPILLLDYALGHRYRGSAPLALRRAAGRAGETLGWFQVMINVIIAIYYTAVVAWTSMYFIFSFNQAWESADSTAAFFTGDYLHLGEEMITFEFVPGVVIPMIIFWVAVLVVLALGVAKGVQKANVFTIPLLAVSFLALVIGALTLPGAVDGLNAFFTPDFSKLGDPQVWVAAYGQIFFSLSVAFGIMITYSSYQKRRANMSSSGLVVAFGNSSFELLAGVGVFAAIGFFAHQSNVSVSELEGLTGVGLAFMTFPAIVSEMPLSPVFGALFFGSLLLAGFTSLLSILEVVLAGFIDKFGLSRKAATWGVGGPMAIISIVLIGTTSGLIALDTLDFFSNQMGIVGSAIVTVVLVLWLNRRGTELARHLSMISTFKVGMVWQILVGVLAPVVIGIMLFQVISKTVAEGYSGYEGWYLGVFGWGVLALMLIASIVFTLLPWSTPVKGFKAWPVVEGAKPADVIDNGQPIVAETAGKES